MLDRRHFSYLNFIEKFHCTYRAYGAGFTSYVAETVSRTPQYLWPIKHAHKILGTHKRYLSFVKFGDATDYEKKLEAFRVALGDR